MLRIKRKVGEVVVITADNGDEVRVTVDEIEGRVALLSFDAPQSVLIDRLEIHKLRRDK
jgi:carbon storage regulator CsrA